MESQLTSLERKIDELLATVDDQSHDAQNASSSPSSSSHHDTDKADEKTQGTGK